MSITRFSVIPGRGLLLGADKANLFEEGVVYEAFDALGEIILRPVGRFALPETGYPSIQSQANPIIESALHLITPEEKELLWLESQKL